jgi:amidase
MARTVKDAAYLLQAIAGRDPYDNYTSAIPFKTLPDYVAACQFDALKGIRLGIPRNLITHENGGAVVLAAFEQAIATIRKAGATVIDNTNVTEFAYRDYINGTVSGEVLEADFISDLPSHYLSQLTKNPHGIISVATLQNFTRHFPLEDYPDRNTATWAGALKQGFGNTDPRFWPLYQHNIAVGGIQGVLGVIKNNSLDALILPTDFSPDLPARVGSPVVTVPMGFYPANRAVAKSSRGLVETGPNIPFGLSFMGLKWNEARLISYAYAYEQRTMVRNKVQPYIVPNTELSDVISC